MHESVHLENEETKEAKGPSSFSGGLISFTSTWEAPRKTQMPSRLPVKKHIIVCAKQHLWINTMWLYIYIYIYKYRGRFLLLCSLYSEGGVRLRP